MSLGKSNVKIEIFIGKNGDDFKRNFTGFFCV